MLFLFIASGAAQTPADDLPAEVAWLAPFSNQIVKNPQGFWQFTFPEQIEMVYIPSGEFTMGSRSNEFEVEANEMPRHRVWIKSLLMARFEVTRSLWNRIMGETASGSGNDQTPMASVSYHEVQTFLSRLRSRTGLLFRLPSEAEWEKCARAGSSSEHYGSLDRIAWSSDNSRAKLHPVGLKQPNTYGLYDMLGNVWEWCSDWFSADYYTQSPYRDPQGPEQGDRKITRGGGFQHHGRYLRLSHRNDMAPEETRPHLGFRLVLDADLRPL